MSGHIDRVIESQGWNDSTMVELLREFIEAQDLNADLFRFLIDASYSEEEEA